MTQGIRTGILLGALTALFMAFGELLGGHSGITIAFMIAMVINMGAYWYSDKLVLSWYKAKPIDFSDKSGLYETVANLAKRAQLPMPKVYLIEADMPNAFATGRNPKHASVAATTGLVGLLNQKQLIAVMAHELSHIRHRDTLISAISATMAGAISMLTNLFMWTALFSGSDENESPLGPIGAIAMMIFTPIAAGLIQFAISRSREFQADYGGAKLCGHPEWLASALQALEQHKNTTVFKAAETNPASAHLFIMNPLKGVKLAHLFSTHPSTSDRIKRLIAMQIERKNDDHASWLR